VDCVVFCSKHRSHFQPSNSIKEQAVIKFLSQENETPIEIQWQLLACYGQYIVGTGIVCCSVRYRGAAAAAEMST
jgi:hypothetical protein